MIGVNKEFLGIKLPPIETSLGCPICEKINAFLIPDDVLILDTEGVLPQDNVVLKTVCKCKYCEIEFKVDFTLFVNGGSEAV